MKFLIAGLGSIGRRHLRNLLSLGERDIILYRTHRSTLPDDELAQFPVETNLGAALAHQPDAVIISNPTAFHLDVAIPAAEAGCHILLEKPVSHTLDRVDLLCCASEVSGSKILMGYHFRYHPGLNKITELLAQGVIGEPYLVKAHWGEYLPGWHPWEDYRQGYSARSDLGGGVVLTLSHVLDYLGWFFGEAANIWASIDKRGSMDISVEDRADMVIEYRSGVTANVHLNYLQRPPSHFLEIIGSAGTVRWENEDGGVHWFSTGDAGTPGWQYIPVQSMNSSEQAFDRNDLFLAEMKHFIKLAQGDHQPMCSLQDGVNTLSVCLAAFQSAREGRKIGLDFD